MKYRNTFTQRVVQHTTYVLLQHEEGSELISEGCLLKIDTDFEIIDILTAI